MSETDLVRIFSVSSGEVAGGLRQFLINATLVANPTRMIQLQTLNTFAASLCQRAHDLNQPIAVTHKRTRFGETLTRAHFLKASAA